jgi:hypothetical protein
MKWLSHAGRDDMGLKRRGRWVESEDRKEENVDVLF